ncbi:MAG: DUF1801 domain-containing protein [Chitinophagaceae bacterium]
MTSSFTDPDEYIKSLPPDRVVPVSELRTAINKNLPAGFKETMSYGMLTWVIPFETYPAGYHCDPKQQLPFVSLASQKNYISFYHMGLYSMPGLMEWFQNEYAGTGGPKLDMGKSCIRFKKPGQIPVDLLSRLLEKVTPSEWISVYEKNLRRS